MSLDARLTPALDAGGITARLARSILDHAGAVRELAEKVHGFAEIAFEEERSAEAITALLASEGFRIVRGVGGVPTAFTAERGTGARVVVFCAEYDALPGIGHACGHNLIAGASVQAALALASVADELGVTVRVIGTPAEEHGAGKVPLLEAGVFDGAAVALMLHPVSEEIRMDPVGTTSQAVARFRAEFRGVASHAAAAPHRGVNAADAATIAQVAIGLLRQQLPDDHRVASFISHGGEVTNIIPARVDLDLECRAFTMAEYEALRERVDNCLRAGALATGTTVTISTLEPVYEPLVQDAALGASWREAMELLGFDLDAGTPLGGGSTDMGNVTRRIPGLHPWVPLPGVTHAIHTPEFAAAATTDSAYEMMHLGAFGLALAGSRVG